jgi:hypothetical protein
MSGRTIGGVPPAPTPPSYIPPPREPAKPVGVARVVRAPIAMRGPVGPGARPAENDDEISPPRRPG